MYPRAAETKREEAGRFIRARSDPAFAKMVRVRQLGPEQMENQRKIRLQMQAAIASADQLEEHMLNLKKRLTDEKLGRQSFKCVLQFVTSMFSSAGGLTKTASQGTLARFGQPGDAEHFARCVGEGARAGRPHAPP